ncbi:hypothetical protein [Ekhidna sp.]|jgi:hypothetical protein|uniref:hypothetical protein n=1 Tax=Ekhidna sp. TaxID=2608089 RepID=UPI0032EEB910
MKRFKGEVFHMVRDMDTFQVHGYVITTMGKIERIIDKLISIKINPENKDVFNDVILDSLIMPISSKIIILKNLFPKYKSNLLNDLEELTKIRNLFAHRTMSISMPEEINAQTIDDFFANIEKGYSSMKKLSRSGNIDKGFNAWEEAIKFEKLSQPVTMALQLLILNPNRKIDYKKLKR